MRESGFESESVCSFKPISVSISPSPSELESDWPEASEPLEEEGADNEKKRLPLSLPLRLSLARPAELNC